MWMSGTYLYSSFYYVRGEVKAGPSCGGATICDTTVQINPQSPGPVVPFGLGYNIYHGTEVSLWPNGKNCFWRHDNSAAVASINGDPIDQRPSVGDEGQSSIGARGEDRSGRDSCRPTLTQWTAATRN